MTRRPKGRARAPAAIQAAQLEAQGGMCAYCLHTFGSEVTNGQRLVTLRVVWDHLVPFAYLQANPGDNWVASCQLCNGFKGSKMFDSVGAAQVYIQKRWQAKRWRTATVERVELTGAKPSSRNMRICQECGDEYENRYETSRYCSGKCRTDAYRRRQSLAPKRPCSCGCGVLVDPGAKGRRYVNEDHKRRYEHQARRPRALPGQGRKRALRAEIGQERLVKLWLIADQLGVSDWREALDHLIGEHLEGPVSRRRP